MSREILFRGKSVKDNTWLEGDLIHVFNDRNKNYHPEIVESLDLDSFLWNEVIPETVGQYTGLADKNGVKIFEGDVVQIYDYIHNRYNKRVVIWHDYAWCAVPIGGYDKSYHCYIPVKGIIEVIGNIHEVENER